MTNSRIIYPNADGSISVVIPTGELPTADVALKDVPAGAPFLLATVADIPADRTFRAAWEADFTTPDGEGIGADAWFAAQAPEPAPAPEPEPEPEAEPAPAPAPEEPEPAPEPEPEPTTEEPTP